MDAERLSRLVREAKTGRWEAFGEIVRHYQLPLRLYAARLGLRGEGVDEVTQEAFVRALESLERYDPALSPFLAWLIGITRHVYQQELERRTRVGALAKYLSEREAADSEASELANHRLTVLRSCLQKLPPTARKIAELRFTEDLSLKEIAQRIASDSVGSVSKTLFRIRQQLADCVRLSWDSV